MEFAQRVNDVFAHEVVPVSPRYGRHQLVVLTPAVLVWVGQNHHDQVGCWLLTRWLPVRIPFKELGPGSKVAEPGVYRKRKESWSSLLRFSHGNRAFSVPIQLSQS
jgi:hypothetical protein